MNFNVTLFKFWKFLSITSKRETEQTKKTMRTVQKFIIRTFRLKKIWHIGTNSHTQFYVAVSRKFDANECAKIIRYELINIEKKTTDKGKALWHI